MSRLPTSSRAMRSGIDADRVWLWEDEALFVVALAGRTPCTERVGRIAPVYTVPAHRRRGYGAAVAAACTARRGRTRG